jgi:hypothetical protein
MRNITRQQQRSTTLPHSVGRAWTTPPKVPTWSPATKPSSLPWRGHSKDAISPPLKTLKQPYWYLSVPRTPLLLTGDLQARETVGQMHECRWGLTYLRSWALLEEPPIVQALNNCPAFYGTRKFNTVFTRALHWSLSWAISIQSTPSHPISLRSILILSTQLRLGSAHTMHHVHSVTERSSSSTYSKWCGNLQADHHSHLSLSYF